MRSRSSSEDLRLLVNRSVHQLPMSDTLRRIGRSCSERSSPSRRVLIVGLRTWPFRSLGPAQCPRACRDRDGTIRRGWQDAANAFAQCEEPLHGQLSPGTVGASASYPPRQSQSWSSPLVWRTPGTPWWPTRMRSSRSAERREPCPRSPWARLLSLPLRSHPRATATRSVFSVAPTSIIFMREPHRTCPKPKSISRPRSEAQRIHRRGAHPCGRRAGRGGDLWAAPRLPDHRWQADRVLGHPNVKESQSLQAFGDAGA